MTAKKTTEVYESFIGNLESARYLCDNIVYLLEKRINSLQDELLSEQILNEHLVEEIKKLKKQGEL